MVFEPSLPVDVRALFPAGEAAHRSLGVPLPPGRTVVSEEGDGPGPVLWLSDGPAPAGRWARLLAAHRRSGLWPLLLDALDTDDGEFRPWGSGELYPERSSAPGGHDPAALLAAWWHGNTEDGGRSAVTAPYGQHWPGLAPPGVPGADPDRVAGLYAEALVSANPSMRLGLVAAGSGADALTVVGWGGPVNHTDDTGEISAVVRDWERRYGVRVVGVGFATLLLSVAAPPADRDGALRVAAEHFAFCPDNVWQSDCAGALELYAEQLVGAPFWGFWWD